MLPFNGSASDLLNYDIPDDAEVIDQSRTVWTSFRICRGESLFPPKSLTFLAPKEEVEYYTISSNPSLYLYAQATSNIPIDYTLVIPKPYKNNPITKGTLLIDKPGIYQIKIPDNIKLEIDEIYLLQIGIPCKENPKKLGQVLRLAVKRIPMSSSLAEKLESTEMSLKKAKIYAEEGIWYEALDLSLPYYTHNSSNFAKLLSSLEIEVIKPIITQELKKLSR